MLFIFYLTASYHHDRMVPRTHGHRRSTGPIFSHNVHSGHQKYIPLGRQTPVIFKACSQVFNQSQKIHRTSHQPTTPR